MTLTNIGRTNAIKNGLITKIQAAIPSATVIDDYRLKTYQFSSFNGVLISVKLNNVRDTPMNFGMKSIQKRHGTWVIGRFAIRVLSKYNENEELESITAYNAVKTLKNYLEINEIDDESGIIEIYDTTVREISPKKRAHMAILLFEGKVLAQRPYNEW